MVQALSAMSSTSLQVARSREALAVIQHTLPWEFVTW